MFFFCRFLLKFQCMFQATTFDPSTNILAHFHQMLLPLKALIIIFVKYAPFLVPTMLVKLTPVIGSLDSLLNRLQRVSRANQDKSASSFYSQMLTWVQDLFCNFKLVNNHKIANNSTTTDARCIIITYLDVRISWVYV